MKRNRMRAIQSLVGLILWLSTSLTLPLGLPVAAEPLQVASTPVSPFYAFRVNGQVVDNTGVPVAGAAVSVTPPATGTLISDLTGFYEAFISTPSTTYTVSWAKNGYATLPAKSFVDSGDMTWNVVLPPADNVIQNWGFEMGTGGQWSASGIITPVITNTVLARHTGIYGAILGDWDYFAQPVNVSNTPITNTSQSVAQADNDGTLHTLWVETAPDFTEIYYAQLPTGGAWSAPYLIFSQSGAPQLNPQLTVDSIGNVYAVWGDPTIYFARRSASNIWSVPVTVSVGLPSGSLEPRIGVDVLGRVNVVWRHGNGDIYYAQRDSKGAWSTPFNLSSNYANSFSPQLLVQPNGAVNVAWSDQSNGTTYPQIFFRRRDAQGNWSGVQWVSNHYGGEYSPQLAGDDAGNVHCVWTYAGHFGYGYSPAIVYARWTAGGWSMPVDINIATSPSVPSLSVTGSGHVRVTWSDTDGLHFARRSDNTPWTHSILDFSLPGVSSSPQVVSHPNDEDVAYLAWSHHGAGANETYYSQQNSSGTWSAAQNVSNTSAESLISKLAVDPEGQIHILWLETLSGVTDLFAISPRYASTTRSSSLTQVVTLPMTNSVPVLSFLYQLNRSSANNNSGLEVQIQTDSATTTVFSATTHTVAWTHQWLNLSDWAGQTLTLTFTVNEVMGTLPVWAYLDEVSLGSAHSDVWTTLSAPTTVQPDDTLTYQLTYGNQGGAPAPATQLTLTLPAELTFVDASLPPLTTTSPLVWNVGDLIAKGGPNTIVVTTTVSPTALSIVTGTVSIATGTTELEIANNAGQASTFVRYQIFLPLIRRN